MCRGFQKIIRNDPQKGRKTTHLMVSDKTSGTPENLVSENNSRHEQTNTNQKSPYAFHFVFCNDPSLKLFFFMDRSRSKKFLYVLKLKPN